MTTQNTNPEDRNVIEDLTVSETETENVKGGHASDRYLLDLSGVKGESEDVRK